ncbi:MAG TPA: HAMP domain-containing sensor histidine kinase [Terriglobia bacterium]|nr:HAMP domain-containing sensor histidine kinase [Terriglobia bacterium]
MVKIRLRTKFLVSLIFTTTALTFAVLYIVRSYLRNHARQEIHQALSNSVITFQHFEQQRQTTLAQSAGVIADLPSLRALMTTHHQLTIQDGSTSFWRLAGCDLFLLADRSGKVMALHTSTSGFNQNAAQDSLAHTLSGELSRDWWFGGGHLYEVFLQPIFFGSSQDNNLLGVLAMGFEVDEHLAEVVAQIASSQVAFRYGKNIVVSTLSTGQKTELASHAIRFTTPTSLESQEIQLGREHFLDTTLELAPKGREPVSLTVLKSFDAATLFLQDLNRLLLAVGFLAVLAGTVLIFLISHTFTRPLANLVAGVHALGKGDFTYPLNVRSNDELAEVTNAFDGMRKSLQKSQRDLLHAERLATIGRTASSISHDLRHPLTAVLAYAELLSESKGDDRQRKDLFQEIRSAVSRMTELISSLLEFSKAQESLRLSQGDLFDSLQRTVETVRLRPEFSKIEIRLRHEGPTEGWFDFKKLDRALHNLLLNACEAVPSGAGKIDVRAKRVNDHVEIAVTDNGAGIPESVRDEVFQPFVTYGKDGGTGLGLAVAQKIASDHGGNVKIESTGPSGTTIKLSVPLTRPSKSSAA